LATACKITARDLPPEGRAGLACEHPEAGRPGYFVLPDSGGWGATMPTSTTAPRA